MDERTKAIIKALQKKVNDKQAVVDALQLYLNDAVMSCRNAKVALASYQQDQEVKTEE